MPVATTVEGECWLINHRSQPTLRYRRGHHRPTAYIGYGYPPIYVLSSGGHPPAVANGLSAASLSYLPLTRWTAGTRNHDEYAG